MRLHTSSALVKGFLGDYALLGFCTMGKFVNPPSTCLNTQNKTHDHMWGSPLLCLSLSPGIWDIGFPVLPPSRNRTELHHWELHQGDAITQSAIRQWRKRLLVPMTYICVGQAHERITLINGDPHSIHWYNLYMTIRWCGSCRKPRRAMIQSSCVRWFHLGL